MSYTYSNEIRYSDSPNIDAFGRLRVSQTTSLLDIKHLHDKLPLLVDEEIGGNATSVFTNSSVLMSTINSGDYVVRQSIKSPPYQAGKSQLFEASFSGFNLQSGIVKRVGYFTSNTLSPFNSGFDGFFLESDGDNSQISFQIWKNGSLILKELTTNWLTQDYDVSLIDWSKTQLMFVDFQWLGVGRLRFSMVIDGIPKLFVVNTAANNISNVYMDSPNKPVRYEIRASTGTIGSFSMICSGVSMEGSINELFKQTGVENYTERTLTNVGTYPLLGIRFSPGTIGVSGRFSQIDILQTANDNYFVTIQQNPILSGSASWSSISNTPIQYSQGTGALTVSTPGHVMRNYLGKSGSLGIDNYNMGSSAFSLGHKIDGTPTEWWICITTFSQTSKFRSSANLEYFG